MYQGGAGFFARFPEDWKVLIALFATLFKFSREDLETMNDEQLIFWKKESELVIKAMEKGNK